MHKKRGTTLMEVAVSLMFTAIVGTSVLLVMSSGSRAMQMTTMATAVESNGQDAMKKICDRLVGADLTSVLPPNVVAPGSTSSITFQRVVAFENGVVIWSNPERISLEASPTDPDDGLDNNDNGLVDEGQVIWTENPGLANEHSLVICSWVRENLVGEVPGNGVDDNGNNLVDEAGLSFDFDGRRLSVRLSLERPSSGLGLVGTSTVQKVVILNDYTP
jgi:hypothetical protein